MRSKKTEQNGRKRNFHIEEQKLPFSHLNVAIQKGPYIFWAQSEADSVG
jgi:hypothetical protein